MRKILVTGMSGTGKSSALAELERLGFQVVDTDLGGWSEWSEAEGGFVWREDRMTQLLARDGGPSLYISGTVSNQGRFYDRFDAVVLLAAPTAVLLNRIENRTTNAYGKAPEQRETVLRDLAEVEPLLRRTCTTRSTPARPWRVSLSSSQNLAESLPLRSTTRRLGLPGRSACRTRPSRLRLMALCRVSVYISVKSIRRMSVLPT